MSLEIACSKKRAYPTVTEAKTMRNQRQHTMYMRLYAYKCQRCEWFHLTKLKPPKEAIV